MFVALLIVISIQSYWIAYHVSIVCNIWYLYVKDKAAWDGMKKYYKYINHDCDRLRVVLVQIYGNDIASIIMEYYYIEFKIGGYWKSYSQIQ